MSQNLSFDIKIPEGQVVTCPQEATFENFIGQFQLYCPKLLCVIDGTCLRYYDKKGDIPTNLRFDYKQRRNSLTEYYFRHIIDDTLYCVFGREAASIFYPRINDVDPTGINELSKPPTHQSTDSSIYSHDAKYLESINHSIDTKYLESVDVFNIPIHSQKHTSKPKRPPIVQAITTSPSRNKLITPNHITIIDNGTKLSFPNPNYIIEIKTYYPA